ncbi:hypothetical protein AL755_16550 [Arthrobacter sp. ERGS1:01]|uniref:hypothetical protein n=1 Tax=Arthrobacter sp. ERGS1:01 TaxID=1704044 RepID=UPI0006B47579|nr:hypothetical protein [Arthrobacter sp. ERGS1:01]ALE06692.1 hypothetical protein AL755_16550 [Arthrobacter sp. ERGS1:01]
MGVRFQARSGRAGVLAAMAGAAVAAIALAGCTVTVPAPATGGTTAPPSQAPTFAAPTTQAGHDAAAVAAKNLTFAAGNTLSARVPVAFSDALGQPSLGRPGPAAPEWTQRMNNVAGQTRYTNAAGCQLAYWVNGTTGPLVTAGDDKASTVRLMEYLIPSLVPGSLAEASLPWSAEPGRKSPTIAFLGYTTRAGKGVPASTVWGRVLGTAGTGLVVTLACPSDALLAATKPQLLAKLSVAPPSN